MMLIGITGGSGTGKSTVANLLCEKIDHSIAINLDEYMRKHCNEHREKIISELNLKIGNDHWSTHLVNSYDDIKKWVSIIEHDMEKTIRNIISENKAHTNAIILDWVFLPLLSLYNECDFSILVKCDLFTKLDRLTKRLEKNNKLEKWVYVLLNRLKNTSLDEFGHSATYTISNNGSLDDLEHNIDCILGTYTTPHYSSNE